MQIYLSWGGAWCEIGFRALGCSDLRSGLCSVAWNALLSQIAFDDERGKPTSLSSDSVTQEVWFLTPSSPLSALHHGSCVLLCLWSLVFLTVFRAANSPPVTL